MADSTAMNGKFVADVDAWVKGTKKEMLEKTQLIMLEAFTRVIFRSPVLTGRFRGSWQLGINKQLTDDKPEDTGGSVTISFMASQVEAMKLGDIGYFMNAQPYALKLEYGYSKKAPNGMIRVTMAEMGAIVSEATRS